MDDDFIEGQLPQPKPGAATFGGEGLAIAGPGGETRMVNIPLISAKPEPRPEELFGPAAPPGADGSKPADNIGQVPMTPGPMLPGPAGGPLDTGGTKIFLGGLNYDTEEQGLRAYFGKWGSVADCLVLRDRETEKSRGFGFVTLVEEEAVELILREPTHEIDGRNLTVRRASPRGSGPLGEDGQPKNPLQAAIAASAAAKSAAAAPTGVAPAEKPDDKNAKKVFLGGLDANISEDQVRQACGAFGKVDELQMMSSANTPSGRGFGFVTFASISSADLIVSRVTIEIAGKKINVQP